MSDEVKLEPFRSTYEQLQRIAHIAWRDEYGISSFPDLYRPAYLEYLLKPITDPELIIGGYLGDELVCFFANLPRNYSLRGQKISGILSCLLFTRREFLRKGIAIRMIKEAEKLNKKFHFDCSLLYLETGHGSRRLFTKLIEQGNPVEKIKTMSVFGRILDLERAAKSEKLKPWEHAMIKLLSAAKQPKSEPNPNVRRYRAEDLSACLELLNGFQKTANLARIWTEEDLGWELDYEGVSYTLLHKSAGKVDGLINYVVHDHISEYTEKWAWINHIAYPKLSHRQRKAFVQDFLRRVKDQGCIGAVEWTKNVYPALPLWTSRFIPYFRSVDMMSWTFNQNISLAGIKDVYEVQI